MTERAGKLALELIREEWPEISKMPDGGPEGDKAVALRGLMEEARSDVKLIIEDRFSPARVAAADAKAAKAATRAWGLSKLDAETVARPR